MTVIDSQHDLIALDEMSQAIPALFHKLYTLMVYIWNDLDAHGSHKYMNAYSIPMNINGRKS